MTNVHPLTRHHGYSSRGRGRGGSNNRTAYWNLRRNAADNPCTSPPQPVLNEDKVLNSNKNGSEGTISSCEDSENDNCTSSDSPQDLEKNGKKKTPMCLVNELARHHKIQPQYKLTGEIGPAHQKTFTVSLKLGDEEYTASGPSIKKAQHGAAQLALQNSKFPMPQPKPKVKASAGNQGDTKPITPTVQLNALAMKLNLPPVYTCLPPIPSAHCAQSSHSQLYSGKENGGVITPDAPNSVRLANSGRGAYLPRFIGSPNQRYYVNRFPLIPMIHRVSLTVGDVTVLGEGASPQAARHNAAKQALEKLRESPTTSKADELKNDMMVVTGSDAESDIKSPVSVIHEIALKLGQDVEFLILTESGPPHMKNFVIQCKLGEWSTHGDGNCKKLAKRKAAELMLAEIKKALPNGIVQAEASPATNPRLRQKAKPVVNRRKPRNLVKEALPSGGTLGRPQDPISHLVQLQQARKEKEPSFVVISEKGIPRQPEFVVQVTVGTIVATGSGSKKKDAKRAAALRALEAMGVETSGENPGSAWEQGSSSSSAEPVDAKVSNGVAIPRPNEKVSNSSTTTQSKNNSVSEVSANGSQQQSKPMKNSSSSVRSENRLIYLAKILGHEVEFTDFPKGSSFISLVTINTDPPQVSHGTGPSLEEAHDNAADSMLKLLAEGGLDMLGDNSEDKGRSIKY